MFYRLKNSLYRLMYGRYGIDGLYKFCLFLYLLFVLLASLLRGRLVSGIFYVLSLVFLFIMFFRCFSKNIYKRQKENQRYLAIRNAVTGFFRLTGKRMSDKTHIYRKCPACKSVLRLPKKKGHHTVCCPRCHKDFRVKV